MKLTSLFHKKPDNSYICTCCGKVYNLPLCIGWDYPDYYFSIPENERKQRVEMQPSLCVIDEEHFFHRGRLTIPIIDHDENLIYNVWTSISADNFSKRMDIWNSLERVNEAPYFGWMQTALPGYENTLNLKMRALENEPDFIPTIECIEEGHQLYIDQEKGITLERAKGLVTPFLCEH